MVEEVEGRVEGRRFAGTRGARDEEYAVRHSYDSFEHRLVVGEKAEFGEPEPQALLVENTHNDALPVHGREARYAQVDFLIVKCYLDSAVLRHALFGDGYVGHQFEARND